MSDFENIDEFMDFMDYIYDDEPYNYPARRYLRDAANPFEVYDNDSFQRRFRFRKDTVIQVIFPLLSITLNNNNRGLPVPPLIQLLVALKFYATGLFQIDCGDLHKLSQATVSKIVSRISQQLAPKVGQFIKFPPNSELPEIKRKFYQRARFPGVVGCIDCTHVPIYCPTRQRGELFRNRKGVFSINVQIVCGPQMEIYDFVCRWPGSVHDSRIFSNSRCCMRFEEGNIPGILIGDSGYAQNTYMYTPMLNPQTPAEQRYNRAHISTRNIIERLNGVLKRRFACLARVMQNDLANIVNITVTCAILHNICILTNEVIPEEDSVSEEDEVPVPDIHDTERGSIIRRAFILRHFS